MMVSPIVPHSRHPMPAAVLALLAPREDLSVSHWCDLYRHLDRRFTAEPGPWRTAKVPYMREPLDAFSDPSVEEIVFMKCSRVGGTEWLNNIMAYSADVRPMPTMYVQPLQADIEDEFTGRLRSLFQSSSKLREHIPPGEWANKTQLNLDSMTIYGAWATSANTLIRKTIGLAIFDEIDNCELAAGPLGNTLKLLKERLVTFGFRAKLITDGTPKKQDGSGWRALEGSDYHRPHVPCPLCGFYQILSFDQLKVAEDQRNPDEIESKQLVRYKCIHCDQLLNHKLHHRFMIDRVVWIPKAQTPVTRLPVGKVIDPIDFELIRQSLGRVKGKKPSDAQVKQHCKHIVSELSLAVPPFAPTDPRYGQHQQWRPHLEGTAPTTRKCGYWINVLYSPWPTRTWSHILAEWFRVHKKADERRVFLNSWLGQPFVDSIEKTSIETLRKKREGALPSDVVPDEARILIMGADVQLDHLYYIIRAWGPDDSSWLIRYGTLTSFDQLYQLAFFTGFPMAGDPKKLMRCEALAIDSGYALRLDEVYQFAKRPGVVPVKGQQSADYRTRPSKIEYLPRGGAAPYSILLHHVNTDLFKQKITRLMNNPPGQMGYWGLNRDVMDDYIKHNTNEHQVWETIKGGRQAGKRRLVWKPVTEGARVDLFDCEVYGAAIADAMNVPLIRESDEPRGLMVDVPTLSSSSKRKRKSSGQLGGFI